MNRGPLTFSVKIGEKYVRTHPERQAAPEHDADKAAGERQRAGKRLVLVGLAELHDRQERRRQVGRQDFVNAVEERRVRLAFGAVARHFVGEDVDHYGWMALIAFKIFILIGLDGAGISAVGNQA